MQKSLLSSIALFLILIIIFFALLTQRVLLSKTSHVPEENNRSVFLNNIQNLSYILKDVPNFLAKTTHYNLISTSSLDSSSNLDLVASNLHIENPTDVEIVEIKPSVPQKEKNIFHSPKDLLTSKDPDSISPRNGTDISIQHQLALLQCNNQTKF